MQWHQLDHMQTICTSLHTDSHTNTSSPNFYRPDAVPDAQPTVPKHWRCNNQKSRYTCIWCFTLHSCCMLLTVTFLNFLHWINCRLVNILYWSWLQVDMHQIQTDIQSGLACNVNQYWTLVTLVWPIMFTAYAVYFMVQQTIWDIHNIYSKTRNIGLVINDGWVPWHCERDLSLEQSLTGLVWTFPTPALLLSVQCKHITHNHILWLSTYSRSSTEITFRYFLFDWPSSTANL